MVWPRRLFTLVAVTSALSAAGLSALAFRGRRSVLVFDARVLGRWFELAVTPEHARIKTWLASEWSPNLTAASRRRAAYDGRHLAVCRFDMAPDGERFYTRMAVFWADRGADHGTFGYLIGSRLTAPPVPSTRAVWLPTWAVLATTSTPAACILGTRLLRRRRFGPGRCRPVRVRPAARRPARCPECGAVPPAARSATMTS